GLDRVPRSRDPKGRSSHRSRPWRADQRNALRSKVITIADFSPASYLYWGPVLRHPAELMLPAVDLGGRVWLGSKSCKGGPAAPAFGGCRASAPASAPAPPSPR